MAPIRMDPPTAISEIEAAPMSAFQGYWRTPRTVRVESEAEPTRLTLDFIRTLRRGRGARVDLMHEVHTDSVGHG